MITHQERELLHAARVGNTARVKILLKQGINVNVIDEEGHTPLLLALCGNHYETVRVIGDTADVCHKNNLGQNALINAIAFVYDKSIVAYLIEKGARFSSRLFEFAWHGDLEEIKQLKALFGTIDSSGKSALHYAAAAGHLGLVKWFIRKGGLKASEKDKEGYTALLYAIWNGHLDLSKWLIKKGGASLSEKSDHANPLHLAAINGHTDTVKWLVETAGMSILETNGDGAMPIHYAVMSGWLETLSYLLKIDPGLIAVTDNVNLDTPLLFAARYGRLELVKYLLQEGGATISEVNKHGSSALHLASLYGHVETVEWLLDEGGANPYEKNNDDYTPVLLAASKGELETLQLLLKKGDDRLLAARTINGHTALLLASKKGHFEMVKWLLEEGDASMDERADNGETALTCAAYDGHFEIMKWLLEEGGAKLSEDIDAGGNTALHCAAYCGHIEIVQWLVEKGGVDIAQKNKAGYTAFLHAVYNDNRATVEWLLDKGGANIFDKDNDGLGAIENAVAAANVQLVELLLARGAGIRADFTGYDLTAFNMKDQLLMGAKMDSQQPVPEGCIQTHEQLQAAIKRGIAFNCVALQKAVSFFCPTNETNDSLLQETRRILNALYHAELRKAIARGETRDWIGLRKEVIASLAKYPDEQELIEIKRTIESSSLTNRCIFYCADNLNSFFPNYKTRLSQDLVPIVEKVAGL